jgi:hypothetical protein
VAKQWEFEDGKDMMKALKVPVCHGGFKRLKQLNLLTSVGSDKAGCWEVNSK